MSTATTKKLGRQTAALANPPSIAGHACVVGKKEGDGPLAEIGRASCRERVSF